MGAAMVMAITIAGTAETASRRVFLRELTSSGKWLWSGVHPPANNQGKQVVMSGKSPNARGTKKVAQASIKEKRAAKRAKRESDLIKPRKGA